VLLVLGLAISIPLIIYGSKLILGLMGRFPIIITLGAALLGWVAGEMLVEDSWVSGWINSQAHFLHLAIPVLCTVGVVIVGKWMDARNHRPQAAAAA
ncbi:MAG: TerC family protein, partial [Rubrivivax sp.]